MRGLAGAAFFLIVFAAIAGGISRGLFDNLDRTLLLALRTADTQDPIGPHWVETMFVDLTALGGTTLVTIITLVAAGYLLIDGKRGTALLVLGSIGGGMLLNNVLKYVFERPRPELVAHAVEVQTTSFPSGHAMLSAVAYLTLGVLLARVERRKATRVFIVSLAVAITLAVGISRIYLGVHWPTDVLAGWSAGAAWALICWEISNRLQRRGKIEKAD